VWVLSDTPELTRVVFTSNEAQAFTQKTFDHVSLQVLNRQIPEKTGRFFNEEAFKPTINSWEGIPMVFAQEHLNVDLPVEEGIKLVKAVDGPARIISQVKKPRVEAFAGQTRLMCGAEISDKKVLELHADGKLSLSTAFVATVNKNTNEIVGDVVPHHVLVFMETRNDQPKDKGAFINKLEGDEVKEAQMQAGKTISAKNKGKLQALKDKAQALLNELTQGLSEFTDEEKAPATQNSNHAQAESHGIPTAAPAAAAPSQDAGEVANNKDSDPMSEKIIAELTEKVVNAEKLATEKESQLQAVTAERDAFKQKAEAAEKERDAFKAEVEANKKAQDEAAFAAFLQKLPPGATHTQEQKDALKKQWDANPKALIASLPEILAQKDAPTQKTGKEAVANGPGENPAPKRLGTRNPYTGKWE
jgi:hypothetical protein